MGNQCRSSSLSREIQPEQWQRRGTFARLLERGAALFTEQY